MCPEPKSHHRDHSLLQAITDPVITLDLDLRIQWANQAALEWADKRFEGIKGRYCFQIWHERDSSCGECPVRETIRTGEPREGETESPDGRRGHIRSYPLHSPEGHLEGVAALILEIAGDKQTEQIPTQDPEIRKERDADHKHDELRRSILLSYSRDGIVIINQNHRVVEANQAFARMLGYSLDEVHKLYSWDWEALSTKEDIQNAFSDLSRIDKFFETRHRRKDGTLIDVEVSISGASVDGENVVIAICRDITDRKKAETALQESEQRFRTVLENLPGGIFVHDFSGRILLVNDRACTNTGYSREELSELSIYDIDPYAASREDYLTSWQRLETGQSATIESVHHKKDGNQYPSEIHLNAIFLDGEPCILTIAYDITERKRMEYKLKEMSIYDSLTGLYNRNFFEEELKRLSDGRHDPIWLIVCDLDGLKSVNDTLGHSAGDQMIINTAEILQRNFRSSDIIARIGGDEFAVLLPQTSREVVEQIAQRLHRAVKDFNSTNPEPSLSLSVGRAVSEGENADMQALFREADNRMYREKVQRKGSTSSAILQGLIGSMQSGGFYSEDHSEPLQELALALARSTGLSQASLQNLFLLTRFHDLNKEVIPDHILLKTEPLTEEEKERMRRHCETGHQIASSVPELEPIADLILKHHERWDGLGYPLGLSDGDIPLVCRILAIAEAYEIMISDRPYRKAIPPRQAMDELRRRAGTQFDPELVGRFIELLHDEDAPPAPGGTHG